MDVRYELIIGLPAEPILASLIDQLVIIFSNQSRADLLTELTYQQERTALQLVLAFSNGQVVGCKLGYERKPHHFYSWLGGVHPDFRGYGIASELMRRQHDWCRQQNYHTVRTQTYNQWRGMLILNLRVGFDIIGTLQGKHGLTIVLEKNL
ncbi:GNAT family N-acetyltransferase [Spirosoma pollinicola]|uniref:GNAT family N-acetyltransferase n=1 Tax=Spirosoma pollinicola TaxID=2057025 RepID=A0A2K8YS87_9BACT|nr:GNAT family N-acetyltransferase [Spirosoma pollinicola]AUD00486.1 GNAT family N-acetyltransferase [Spirosoma pollinicola]